jgi:hypothetical protein
MNARQKWRLGPRRPGMRLGDALVIGTSTPEI